MNVLEIKAAVRSRDGHCCSRCGMTRAEHLERYGCILHVHRVVPGSAYEENGCRTLCVRCHRFMHRKYPNGLPPRLIIDTEEDIRLAVRLAATKADVSTSALVNGILRKALASEIEDARKYLPRKKKEKGEHS